MEIAELNVLRLFCEEVFEYVLALGEGGRFGVRVRVSRCVGWSLPHHII